MEHQKKQPEPSKQPSPTEPQNFQTVLAILFIGLSVGGIIYISALVLSNAKAGQESEAAKMVFNALLPMLSAWVGTIIAFYFGTQQIRYMTDANKQLMENMKEEQKMQQKLVEMNMKFIEKNFIK